jgi:2-dehydro-3-deoxyphosphogluconate aldolase / (4S)-4-hydroxy-2-oxoglutarate aldolase
MLKSIRTILTLSPVIPVLTLEHLEHAIPIGRALCAGGLRVLEVTLRGSMTLQAIRQLREALPEAIIGAGTLKSAEDFHAAAQAGAQFMVSPGLTPQLAAGALSHPVPLLPGIMTPTELMQGLALGFDTFKLFPAQPAGGLAMLETLAAVFPEAEFCASGDITQSNAPEFLALPNVLCVSGSWPAPPEEIRSGNWGALQTRAREALLLRRGSR